MNGEPVIGGENVEASVSIHIVGTGGAEVYRRVDQCELLIHSREV